RAARRRRRGSRACTTSPDSCWPSAFSTTPSRPSPPPDRTPMNGQIELVAVAVSLGYLLFSALLVRRRQLREKYSMLWLAVGAATVVVSLSRGAMDRFARALGVHYGPTILFLMAVVAHLSWELSRLEERTRKLAEELALLRPRKPAAGSGTDTDAGAPGRWEADLVPGGLESAS